MNHPTPEQNQANSQEYLEKIRQQFESLPYPHKPLDAHPRTIDSNLDQFFIHCMVTPYYVRNQRVIGTAGKVILDAGCGSGYKALRLAEANPGAKIVGVDLSPESVKLAEKRLNYHGHDNCEFHAILIEELPQLGMTFDYINCDETLYLMPNPQMGLRAMKAVLKPDGIIRSNLHSALQRERFFRAQNLFRMMGLMDENPGEMEAEIVRETMNALKDRVDLKAKAWDADFAKAENSEHILMNHLLQGDKGFSIPEMFDALRGADVEFVSMVVWRDWEPTSLFKEPDNLPTVWGMSLPELSDEERLRIYEFLHPVHRLLDFWCGNPDQGKSFAPLSAWSIEDWRDSLVHLHPLLKTDEIREEAVRCVRTQKSCNFSKHIFLTTTTQIEVDSRVIAALLPLWDKPQPFTMLVDHWLKLYPLDPVTLESASEEMASRHLIDWISKLEVFLYLLVEQPNA